MLYPGDRSPSALTSAPLSWRVVMNPSVSRGMRPPENSKVCPPAKGLSTNCETPASASAAARTICSGVGASGSGLPHTVGSPSRRSAMSLG